MFKKVFWRCLDVLTYPEGLNHACFSLTTQNSPLLWSAVVIQSTVKVGPECEPVNACFFSSRQEISTYTNLWAKQVSSSAYLLATFSCVNKQYNLYLSLLQDDGDGSAFLILLFNIQRVALAYLAKRNANLCWADPGPPPKKPPRPGAPTHLSNTSSINLVDSYNEGVKV